MSDPRPRRYAICGLSNRGVSTYLRPLVGGPAGQDAGSGDEGDDWSATSELVGIVDADTDRAAQFVSTMLPPGCRDVKVFGAGDTATMISTCRPDTVIVTSPDATHAEHVVTALSAGVDVITEKPMTATAAQAAQVLRAVETATGTLTVAHNMRYTPRHRLLRRMIMDGAVGRPLQMVLDYHVDTRHGASYFVRWNRHQAVSGTLAVHKSSHHLDLAGWLLADRPVTVYARGSRGFYGPDSPHRPRDRDGGLLPPDREQALDPYLRDQQEPWILADPSGQPRRDNEGLGYPLQYPAGTTWSLYDESIDIEDHFTALVGYGGGASLSYSIDFSSPWEGYRLGVTGTHGRLEAVFGEGRDGQPLPGSDQVLHLPLFGAPRSVAVPAGIGGHDGADVLMRHDLFGRPSAESIELGLVATPAQAADAVAAGEAIWRSMRSGEVVTVADLLRADTAG